MNKFTSVTISAGSVYKFFIHMELDYNAIGSSALTKPELILISKYITYCPTESQIASLTDVVLDNRRS